MMLLSAESLLQLLQRFIKNPTQIKQIHSLLITNGDLHSIPSPFTFKWTTTLLYNTLIRAYLNIQHPHTTLLLFTDMLSRNIPPNTHTFPSLAKAVVAAAYITPSPISKPLYTQALKRGVLADLFVQTSFINMYAQSGYVTCARKVFDEMPEPCIVACNAMLDGFCKNGDMGSAISFFEQMPNKDVYSWTSIINGYCKKGCHDTAISFFQQMITQRSFVKPNEATFVSVLSACANGVGGLLYGKQIHGYIIKNEDEVSSFVGTALISFYGKTGGLEYGIKVFENMVKKEICSWNAMIGALASNGSGKQALEMFYKMEDLGWHPNEVTFVAILSACARCKFIDLGLDIFYSMLPEFGVVPQMEHYGCVVDLLGKAGFLKEAKDFISKMPFEADASVWGALLGACRIYMDIDVAREVCEQQFKVGFQECGQYILMSSIYADVGFWDHATSLRKVMVGAGLQKPPAYSIS